MHILAKCKNCKIDYFVLIMPNNVNTEWIWGGGGRKCFGGDIPGLPPPRMNPCVLCHWLLCVYHVGNSDAIQNKIIHCKATQEQIHVLFLFSLLYVQRIILQSKACERTETIVFYRAFHRVFYII